MFQLLHIFRVTKYVSTIERATNNTLTVVPNYKSIATMNYDNKIEDYKNRYKEWRDLSVNQLSNVNNVFTSLSIGFLALIFKPKLFIDLTISVPDAELKPTILCFSLLILVLSILFGLFVLLTRLNDFRISRHLALTRQRTLCFYESKKGLLPNNRNDDNDFNFCDRLKAFCKIIFCRIEFVTREDIEKKEVSIVKKKFERLQKLSDILGIATWRWLKLQILFFLLSIVLYGFFISIK
jgi:hypothetical protein